MPNMSYCRFQNTLSDLRDCREALEQLMGTDPSAEPLSREEIVAAARLAAECGEFLRILVEAGACAEESVLDDIEEEGAIREIINEASRLVKADREVA